MNVCRLFIECVNAQNKFSIFLCCVATAVIRPLNQPSERTPLCVDVGFEYMFLIGCEVVSMYLFVLGALLGIDGHKLMDPFVKSQLKNKCIPRLHMEIQKE